MTDSVKEIMHKQSRKRSNRAAVAGAGSAGTGYMLLTQLQALMIETYPDMNPGWFELFAGFIAFVLAGGLSKFIKAIDD